MADFLPEDYEVKDTSEGYMRLVAGENRFRILSSPIIGQEWWTEEKKQRIVHRRRKDEKISPDELGEDPVRQFWAMVVYNYKLEKIQILEITQKMVMRTIQNLSRSEDWGNPKGTNGYDIVITREGEGRETRYEVLPKPPKKLTEGIMELYKDMNIDLEALFSNGDPYANTPNIEQPKSKEKVDADEIDLVLGGEQ